LQGSGFQDRQWLVQRDGRFIQLTELLYHIASTPTVRVASAPATSCGAGSSGAR
jgi:hypothetical protein